MPATISQTQALAFTALGDFLTFVLPSACGVFQAQVNQVAQPAGPDYVMMTPIRQERLAWNETGYVDNVLTGSIAATVLTVTAVSQSQGAGIQPGMVLTDGSYPNLVAANTTVVIQLTGTPGGAGTYTVSPSQTLASETLYAGQRQDLVPTRWVVQLDIYGPNSADNTKLVEGTFFSSVAADFFSAQPYAVQALHASDARQIPFINASQQYENRWTMDLHLEIDPTIGTSIQFADQVQVGVVEAAVNYTGA